MDLDEKIRHIQATEYECVQFDAAWLDFRELLGFGWGMHSNYLLIYISMIGIHDSELFTLKQILISG